jgi:DNA-binding NarL/FixJ family response regulator
MSPIRVILADDHPVVRNGIRHLLEKVIDIEVLGEASTGGEALSLVQEMKPDILLLDMEMPDLNGREVAAKLQQMGSPVKSWRSALMMTLSIFASC